MSKTDEPYYLTASELVAHYARHTLSPREVIAAIFARIARHDRTINAFVVSDEQAAQAAARASEQRWLRGASVGPLDGVPVSIKDLLQTRGLPTRRGSRTTDPRGPWEEDAPAVARLREAGAIVFAKTTTTEFGLKGQSDSPLTGLTRNPFNLAHTTGGSSAGAVAATAAGFGPIAIGTDGGGSIRIPSAYTGVIGLKPGLGRVPTDPPTFVGTPPHVGPIARSVADLALVLGVIARADLRDPFRAPIPDFAHEHDETNSSLKGVRIGFSATLGQTTLRADVARVFAAAIDALREAGAQVEEADPGLPASGELLGTLFAARAAETVRTLDPARRALLDPAIEAAAREGERLSAVALLAAEAERVRLAQAMARYHERFDLLVTPTSALPAPLAKGAAPVRTPFVHPFSLTRQPALSIPAGVSEEGLPLGLQIVGRHFDEALVLRGARAFERTHPFRAPPLSD